VSLEENKAIVRKVVETLNKRDLALLDEFVAPDFVDHAHRTRGLEEYKQYVTMVRKGFPDYNETIEDIIAEGDKVWVRNTFTGTHVGDFMGFAPTGKKITETAVQMYCIVNGKVVENLQVSNPLGLLIQLGAVEYTEKGKKLFPQDVT